VNYLEIPRRPDCQALVTEESRNRRSFYRDQERRGSTQLAYQGDYLSFLRDCQLRLTIRRMTAANIERVHELTQRTNQMNFSGTRYSREELQALLQNRDVDTYVLDCDDRFGNYGTIGFCVVNRSALCMTDLMFSCRIQGKRVEHAFVSHLLRQYRSDGAREFHALFRKTKKNAGPGKVFADLAFREVGEVEGVTRLIYTLDAEVGEEYPVAIQDASAQMESTLRAE
jgi:FkbH-like protein